VKRRDVEFLSLRWVLLAGVLMFVLGVLMDRYVWEDGFEWVDNAVVAGLTTAFMGVFGWLQRPPSPE
jgi:hypothetical protein